MNRSLRFLATGLLWLGLALPALAQLSLALPGAASPAPAPPAATSPPAGQPQAAPPVTPIAIASVAVQAQDAAGRLTEMQEEIGNDHSLDATTDDIADLAALTNSRIREVRRLLNAKPSLETLRNLQPGWESTDRQTTALTRDLTRRATDLDHELDELAKLDALWQATSKAASQGNAPAEVTTRIEATIKSIATTRTQVEQRRTETLTLQSKAADLALRVDQTRDNLAAESRHAVSRLLQRDSQPFWAKAYWLGLTGNLGSDGSDGIAAQSEALSEYVRANAVRLVIAAVLFCCVSAALYRSQARVRGWSEHDLDLRRAAAVFETPISMGTVLALACAHLMFSQAPLALGEIMGLMGIVPIVLIVRRLIERDLHPILYALAGFYLLDRLRGLAAPAHALSRLILVIELVTGIVLLLSLARVRRLHQNAPAAAAKATRGWKILRLAAWLCLGIAGFALCAQLLGFAELGSLLGSALLRGAYLGLVLYALTRVGEGLAMGLSQVPPLSYLSMARNHRKLIAGRIARLFRWAAAVLWLLAMVRTLGLWDASSDLLDTLLAASLHLGSATISLEKILSFVVAIVGAVWAARFLSFVLDEEVYPNLQMERGLSYLISTILRYAILLGGFIFGLAALGIDMTKFTILAGAFSVGLGFGLQNIVNNFVSGLIVLFERPMKIGDIVQVGDVMGQVERIGIRASVIRSSNGAEVIIPNGTLIATNLTNWTFSNQSRRVDIQVQVALDSDPDRVKLLLLDAAASHPDVSAEPKPQALLTRLGPETLEFEVRVWSDAQSDWARVRSDLASAIEASLKGNGIAFK